MKIHSSTATDDLQRRLRRIEGQVRGVQRMLDDGRDCSEIVQQMNAIHSAVQNATRLLMRTYAKECLLRAETLQGRRAEAVVDELFEIMAKVK